MCYASKRLLALLCVVCLMLLGACQSAGRITEQNGVTVASDPEEAHIDEIARANQDTFSNVSAVNGTHLERELSGVDGRSLRLDAEVKIPDAGCISRFSLVPLKPNMELAMRLFWGENAANAEVNQAGGGYKLNTADGRTEFMNWYDANGNAQNRFAFSSEASFKDESTGEIAYEDVVKQIKAILNEFGVPDMTITYANRFGGTINFSFVPKFTPFDIVSSMYMKTPANAQAALRPGAIEFVQGRFILEKADEFVLDRLLTLEGALKIVEKSVGGDIVAGEPVYVNSVELRHFYSLDDNAQHISAVPVWYFQTNINEVAGDLGETIPTGLFWVDAVSGELYTAFG